MEGRLYRKSRLDRDSKLKRDISLCPEGRLCRESRLCRETSLGWGGRLCREDWLGIAYSDRRINQFNPTPPPCHSTVRMLSNPSWCF